MVARGSGVRVDVVVGGGSEGDSCCGLLDELDDFFEVGGWEIVLLEEGFRSHVGVIFEIKRERVRRGRRRSKDA